MANSPARDVIDVGSVIADTYTIEALLGRGGMGAVFLASHKRLAGKQVAIKILHTEIEDAEVVARFKREAEIAARLNHPNIVGVIDYNVAPDGTPYLVLDYLEGETLAQRIARGPIPLDEVMSIVRQVGSALTAAHRAGIIHRDLKPLNIFLVPTEAFGRAVEIAKVLDFGISKIRGSQTVKTQESTLLGTPQYMAPEQATGQHQAIDERTDVFAFGAIVYEMLSGKPAFSGASIPEVVFKVVYEEPPALAPLAPAASPAIVAAVMQAMAKTADRRFPTVAAFAEAITGQPLTLTRGLAPGPAAADSPSAARRVATGEAFAQTMGSGDFGSSPVNPLVATGSSIPQGGATAPGSASAPDGVGFSAPASSRSLPGASGASHGASAPGITSTLAAPGATSIAGPPRESASRASGAPVVAAPTIDLQTGPRAEARRRRTPAVRFAAIALAGAAIAAGVVLFAMRGEGPSKAPGARPERGSSTSIAATQPPRAPATGSARPTDSTATEPATSPGGAAPSTTDRKAGAPEATGPEPGDPKGTASGTPDPQRTSSGATDPGPRDPRTTSPARPPAPRPPVHAPARPAPAPPAPRESPASDDEGEPEVRDKLGEASAALEAHEYDRAERLANAVVNSSATPRQKALARLIHGTVQCVARNDQEAAQIDLRSLAGFRALRARLLGVCRSHGLAAP
ncbi:MAG TPA: protein kinase [Kofleriaceae bacterium]|nr:protein kinase [Kofleriaceae bacterium]